MYDPAVVDALLRVSGEIAQEQPVASESRRVSRQSLKPVRWLANRPDGSGDQRDDGEHGRPTR
jgi:hypothetical protein